MLLLALGVGDAGACSPAPNDLVEVVPQDGALDVALDQVIVLRVGVDVLQDDPDVVLRGPDGVLPAQVTVAWFEEPQSFVAYGLLQVIPDATLPPDATISVSLADGMQVVQTTVFETGTSTLGAQEHSAVLVDGGSGFRSEDECWSPTEVVALSLAGVTLDQVAWVQVREVEGAPGERVETGLAWGWVPQLDGLARGVHAPVDAPDGVGKRCFTATLVDAVGIEHALAPSCASSSLDAGEPMGVVEHARCSAVPGAAGLWAGLLGLVGLRRRSSRAAREQGRG